MKSRRICCIKLFLSLFNFIFILSGLVLMAICVINIRDRKARAEQQTGVSRAVLSFLITLGLALVVSAALGFVGAVKENIKITYMYFCVFALLVLVEIVVGIGGAFFTSGSESGSELRIYFFKNATVEDHQINHELWDRMQSENQCCGVYGPQDYRVLHRDVPSSCCPQTPHLREEGARRHLHVSCITEKTYYVTGCAEVIRLQKRFKRSVVIISGTIFIIIQCACILLSALLIYTIRKERRRLQQNLQAHFET